MAFKDNKIKGIISNNTGNGIHSFGAFGYFQYTDANQTDPATNLPLVVDVATQVGLFSSNDTGSNLTEIVLSPTNISMSAPDATLSNVTVWSANSILTQSRADSRYQANGSYLNDLLTTVPMSYGSDALAGMRKSAGSPANFVAGPTSVGGFATVGIVAGNEVSAVEFGIGDIFAKLRLRHYKHTLLIADEGILVETGTANWTWSANSILTQGRADSRYYFANNPSNYLPSANFTYANIGGTIPTATNSTLGAIKVGSNLTIANGVLSATSSGGFQNGDTLNGGTY